MNCGAGNAGVNFDEVCNEPIRSRHSAKPRDSNKPRDLHTSQFNQVPEKRREENQDFHGNQDLPRNQKNCQEFENNQEESQELAGSQEELPDLRCLVNRGAVVQGDWKLNFYSKGTLYTASAAVNGKIITSKFEVFDDILEWLQNITNEKYTLTEAYQMVDYDGISLLELTMNLDSFSRRVPVLKAPIIKPRRKINPLLSKLKKLKFKIHDLEQGIKCIGCHSDQEIIENLLDKNKMCIYYCFNLLSCYNHC